MSRGLLCWFSVGQKGISGARGGETGEKVFLMGRNRNGRTMLKPDKIILIN